MENSSNNKKLTSCCQRIVVILHVPLFPGEVDSNETNQLGLRTSSCKNQVTN